MDVDVVMGGVYNLDTFIWEINTEGGGGSLFFRVYGDGLRMSCLFTHLFSFSLKVCTSLKIILCHSSLWVQQIYEPIF